MTIEQFKQRIEENGAYLVYFTDEYRVDIFKDGRSLGYVHLVKPNKAEWYGGCFPYLMFLLFEFSKIEPSERDYPTSLLFDIIDVYFDKLQKERIAA